MMEWRRRVISDVFGVLPSPALMEANLRYYLQALADGTHMACFAMRGEEPTGCGGICLQRELPSPDNPSGLCAYLMNIYVAPEERRTGTGNAIVAWLVDRALRAGAGKIYLETTEAGRPLYASRGFRPMPDMMKLAD